MNADLTFEARLINAIALREAARRWLNPRRRRILRQRGEGWTLREIAQRECVSIERIRQEEVKAYRLLAKPQAGLGKQLWFPPRPAIISTPPSFDKAAFLRHMRHLIARKVWLAQQAAACAALEESREREREYGVLRRVVAEQEERERQVEQERIERAAWAERMAREERIRVLNELEWIDERERARREVENRHWAEQLALMMEEACRHQGELSPLQYQKYQWLQKLRQTYGTAMAARYIGFPTIAAALKAGGAA